MKKILIILMTIFSFNVFGITLLNEKKQKVQYEKIVKNTQAGIINYVAIWCPHCIKEFEILDEFKKIKPDVDIILIFTDARMKDLDKNFDDIIEYMKEHKYNFKIYYDYNNEFLTKFKITSVPLQSIINQGKLKKNFEDVLPIEDLQYIFRKF